MKRLTWFLILAQASIGVLANEKPAMTPAEEARALIGVEYSPIGDDDRIVDYLSCVDEGRGALDDEMVWSYGVANCQGRRVVMLTRFVKKTVNYTTWHIVDTLLLPPIETRWSPNPGNKLRLTFADSTQCEVRGQPNILFAALIRWGKRNKRNEVDWRTGVEKAWTFDTQHGRIVPLSTKGFTCWWDSEPP